MSLPRNAGGDAQRGTGVLHIPAQTMADEQGLTSSILPLGPLFEVTMMLAFELIVLHLRAVMHITQQSMRARHTNLE